MDILIENSLKNTNNENIAFIDLNLRPKYEFKFVKNIKETDEELVLAKVKENFDINYKYYAITVESEKIAYVKNLTDAEKVISELKQDNISIGILEIFSKTLEDLKEPSLAIEKTKQVSAEVAKIKEEKQIYEESKIYSVALITPVKGNITSRYGTRSSGFHTGLDIAAPIGTQIKACAAGVVKSCGWSGSYGNLVVISHADKIETYYAHCSAIYVKVGDVIEQNQVISAVGSTGNSTGPHLHLEIRDNGETINPQKYIYKR